MDAPPTAAKSDPFSNPAPNPAPTAPEPPDPFLWLEEVEGTEALAWVRAHNAATQAALCEADRSEAERFEADRAAIYEIATRPDNIPFITRRGALVYNFWQDAAHVRGLRPWVTSEYEHNGLRADGERILDRLFELVRGRR